MKLVHRSKVICKHVFGVFSSNEFYGHMQILQSCDIGSMSRTRGPNVKCPFSPWTKPATHWEARWLIRVVTMVKDFFQRSNLSVSAGTKVWTCLRSSLWGHNCHIRGHTGQLSATSIQTISPHSCQTNPEENVISQPKKPKMQPDSTLARRCRFISD